VTKPIDLIRAEAKASAAYLGEAASRLLAWANLLGADPHPVLTQTEVREAALALAKQGGRLSQAVDMTKPRRKK
jgi:hypothetical protein